MTKTHTINTDLVNELVELLKENDNELKDINEKRGYILESLNRLNPFRVGTIVPVFSLSHNVTIKSAWTVINDEYDYTFFAKGSYAGGFIVTMYMDKNNKIVVE
jgi:hypothetical protein